MNWYASSVKRMKSVPYKLAEFVGKPEELLQLIRNERLRSLVAAVSMDGNSLLGDNRPEWAIRAAREFWRCCENVSRSKKANMENYRLGLMLGAWWRHTPMVAESEPAFAAVISPESLGSLLHAELAKEPPQDAADFYIGFSEGLRHGAILPSGPYAIYLILAVLWPELSAMKNVTEIHQWFESVLGANLTGSRARIAKICHKIGLRFQDKGGRPRTKPRTRCSG